MIKSISIVFLADEYISFLDCKLPPYFYKSDRGYSITCRSIEHTGGFVELICDPKVTPSITGEVVVTIPSHFVKLIVSAENAKDIGFLTNGKQSE